MLPSYIGFCAGISICFHCYRGIKCLIVLFLFFFYFSSAVSFVCLLFVWPTELPRCLRGTLYGACCTSTRSTGVGFRGEKKEVTLRNRRANHAPGYDTISFNVRNLRTRSSLKSVLIAFGCNDIVMGLLSLFGSERRGNRAAPSLRRLITYSR